MFLNELSFLPNQSGNSEQKVKWIQLRSMDLKKPYSQKCEMMDYIIISESISYAQAQYKNPLIYIYSNLIRLGIAYKTHYFKDNCDHWNHAELFCQHFDSLPVM